MTMVYNIFNRTRRTLGGNTDFVAPWQLDLKRDEFVKLKTFSLLQKVFTDCYRYSTKIKDQDKENALFDSIVYADAQFGLISRLAYMVAHFQKLYLKYDHGIIREVTEISERKKIEDDYKKGMTYRYGVILDFSKYSIGYLLAHYFHQLYTIEQANNNSIALGGSLQLKVKGFRAKVGMNEALSDDIKGQASEVLKYARDGKPVVIDAEDALEQTESSKNVSVADSARDKCYRELAAAIGAPISYITGEDERSTGSGVSYERLDGRAEDMIKNFWLTVFKPVVESLLGENINFVSQKWQTIKENLGSISMLESIQCVPVEIRASVIRKLIGDNTPDKSDKLEKEIIGLLNTPNEIQSEES